MPRLVPLFAAVLTFVALDAAPVRAQRVVASALKSARVSGDTGETVRPSKKSATIAGLASVTLPGAGHIYAEETGRGLAVMVIYFVAAPIVMGGRTDGLGKVAGVTAIATYLFGILDSESAARRYNMRVASAVR